jgi:hypothetical protein
MENEAEPATTISSAGEKWGLTSEDLKLTKASEEKTKGELTEAQAKNQELSLTADKLTKDLTTTKTDLESTNSKLSLTSAQLQSYTDELKGKKPAELFTELNDLSEKMKVSESENKILNAAKEKLDLELKKLRTEVEMTKPGSAKSISLSGKIVAVNPTWNFVILDLGKNDQLVFQPTIMLNMGSSETKISHITNAPPGLLNFLYRRGKVPRLQTTKFQVESLGLNLDLSYTIGKFNLTPQVYLDYYLQNEDIDKFSYNFNFNIGFAF